MSSFVSAPGVGARPLAGIRHIDHVTYVTRSEEERPFLASWEMLGFRELVRLETDRYPRRTSR